MLVSKLKIVLALLILACLGPVAFLPRTAGQPPEKKITKTEEPTKQQDEKKWTKFQRPANTVTGVVSEVDAQENLITVSLPTARWRRTEG
jgi:hypothetical protein